MHLFRSSNLSSKRLLSLLAFGVWGVFAFGFIFWLHAAIAEVYALQLTFLGLFLYLTARWLRTRKGQTLYLLIFTLALGATSNILLMALIVPAAVYLTLRSGAWVENGQWRKGRAIRATLCGIIGLLPFVYIPLRLAQNSGFISDFVYLNGYEVQSPRWYWWYLSGEEFTTSKILGVPLSSYPALVWSYLRLYSTNCSPVAAILAVAGIGALAIDPLRRRPKWPKKGAVQSRKERKKAERKASRAKPRRERHGLLIRLFSRTSHESGLFGTTLLVAFLCTLFPVLSYQVPDQDVFYMPSFFFLTAFVGLGLHRIVQFLSSRLPHSLALVSALILTSGLSLYLFIHHHPAVTRITGDETRYQKLLEQFERLPENSIIIGEDDGYATRYKYFQIVRGLRPDITVHTLGRLAPRFRGEIALDRPLVRNARDLRLSLNVADRFRILNGLLEDFPGRPIHTILDDRMPPEYDHFRTVRSPVDPHLLKIEPKPPAEASSQPLPVLVRSEGVYFKDLRFVGFEIEGLDRGVSKTFGTPLTFGSGLIDGIVQRSELFELTFVVQRTGAPNAKFIAEFAFVNDRMEIPSAHGFSASKHLEIIPKDLPVGWYRKDGFIFKIPGYIPSGLYTLAVMVNRPTAQVRGTYKGKSIQILTPLQTLKAWRGQYDYQPLGRIWVE